MTQLWMQYVNIDMGNIFNTVIKYNDSELFGCALFKLTPVFFMISHINYRRLMVLNSLELINLNPAINGKLKKGAFPVNHSGKPFLEVAVDVAWSKQSMLIPKIDGIMKYRDVSNGSK